jgi:hypothetical protein
MYKLSTSPGVVIRIEDGAFIPLPPCESNGFEYQDWLAAGNTPDPVPTVVVIVVVPKEVQMGQAQLALLAFTFPDGTNLLDKVDAIMAQQPRADQVTWNKAMYVMRDNALVSRMQVALGLTDAQIDQLFIDASAIKL